MDEHSPGNPPAAPQPLRHSSGEFPLNIFLNENGLRAGWRLLIYAFVFFALLVTFSFALGQFARRATPVSFISLQFIMELISFAAALGAALVMSILEARPLGAYGLPVQSAFGKLFWQGCAFGLLEISALVGIIAAFGGYSFGSLAVRGADLFRWLLFFALFFLVVAFFEEFLFRGYALYTLADGVGFWPAALLLAAGFAAVHLRNPGEGPVGAAGVFLVGIFWSFTLKRTGSLWFALGMHAAFDFGETFLFSVPDSGVIFPGHLSSASLHGPAWLTGGTPGPEGSVIDFVLLFLFFFIFDRLYPAPQKTSADLPARGA